MIGLRLLQWTELGPKGHFRGQLNFQGGYGMMFKVIIIVAILFPWILGFQEGTFVLPNRHFSNQGYYCGAEVTLVGVWVLNENILIMEK